VTNAKTNVKKTSVCCTVGAARVYALSKPLSRFRIH